MKRYKKRGSPEHDISSHGRAPFEPPAIIEQLTLSGRAQPSYWRKASRRDARQASLTSLALSLLSIAVFLYVQIYVSDPSGFGRAVIFVFFAIAFTGFIAQSRYSRRKELIRRNHKSKTRRKRSKK